MSAPGVLQQAQRAADVDTLVQRRIAQRRANPRPRRKMNDRVDAPPGKRTRDIGIFGNIAVDKVNGWMPRKRRQILSLDCGRVISVEIVENDNLVTPRGEPLNDVRANESSSPSDEYSHDVSSV